VLQIISYAMGCRLLAALDATGPVAEAALAEAPGWFAAWERALSRFREDSELVALNRRAGAGPAPVSATLWAVIGSSLEAARMSDGLVTPTLLDALERAGYDRDFAALKPEAPATLSGAPRPTSPGEWRLVHLDAYRRAVTLPQGMRLDLGGFAKGWAADMAVRRLKISGPALVDVGGDIAVSGPQADGSPWPIAVANPLCADEPLDLLLLHAGGVATSGRDYRRWRRGAVEGHHIIDPRNGEPSATDLLTATVVGPSAQEAEAAAKAALILGSDAGIAWLAARPHLAGLLLTEGGQVLRTATLDAYRWAAVEGGCP
jgi:thiamine biosynthesis lipoprotein